jgi:peptidoglycan/xylan/chitin deacetylase (PgdA/CDA1 family)
MRLFLRAYLACCLWAFFMAVPQAGALWNGPVTVGAAALPPPNEVGHIMVLMFHGVDQGRARQPYMCTAEAFQEFLRRLYADGFRTLPLGDLMENRVTTPAGYTPVVLTFDDGLPTAFSLREGPLGLGPDPGCAVGLLERFAEAHPDFGRAATFFINGRPQTFAGDGTLAQRLQWLADRGYELGNHTFSHRGLEDAAGEEIQAELGRLEAWLAPLVPGYVMKAVAYPYGQRPPRALRTFMLAGEYQGRPYRYAWALKEGQNGASAAPNHVAFDPLAIPRVRGTDNAVTDLGWYLARYRQVPGLRYISDGDPDVITVPKSLEEQVNRQSLAGKRLAVYDDKEA